MAAALLVMAFVGGVFFRDKLTAGRGPTITTDLISEDVFASTIQANFVDSTFEDLDDDAIERSIAEINAAIQRSAARRR